MIDTIALLAQLLAGLIIFVTIWGFLPLDHWWVRSVDFPRIQFIVLGFLGLLGLVFALLYADSHFYNDGTGHIANGLSLILLIGLVVAMGFQLRMVLPYTPLWEKEVRVAKNDPDAIQLTIMVSNVLTPNNNTAALVDLVQQNEPDILITLESDKKWQDALSIIESDFAHTVKVPLDNLYGMHLYSKLPLINPKVHYLLIDDIPSIHTQLELPNGKTVWLYCLHPMPPSPTEAEKSTTRDAEILMVGRHIKQYQQTAILAGDLNDVAWSKTTRMFQRISQLLDPRIGRSFINTFHVNYPFLRWALDHIFHSPCFTLVNIKRLPSIGSDHFPVLTTLQYEPEVRALQADNAPVVTMHDKREVEAKIEAGKIEGEKLSQERANGSDAKVPIG